MNSPITSRIAFRLPSCMAMNWSSVTSLESRSGSTLMRIFFVDIIGAFMVGSLRQTCQLVHDHDLPEQRRVGVVARPEGAGDNIIAILLPQHVERLPLARPVDPARLVGVCPRL